EPSLSPTYHPALPDPTSDRPEGRAVVKESSDTAERQEMHEKSPQSDRECGENDPPTGDGEDQLAALQLDGADPASGADEPPGEAPPATADSGRHFTLGVVTDAALETEADPAAGRPSRRTIRDASVMRRPSLSDTLSRIFSKNRNR